MENEPQSEDLNQQPIDPQPVEPTPVVPEPQPEPVVQPIQPTVSAPAPVAPVVPTPPNSSKTLIIIIISAAALLIIGGIVAVLLVVNSASRVLTNNLTNNLTTTPIVQVAESTTKRVGNSDVGYVTVPKDWVKFIDVDAPSVFQYSDGTEDYILTMAANSSTTNTPEEMATALQQQMTAEGATDVTGAIVTVGGYSAYKNYAIYTDVNKFFVSWSFADENDKLHFISIEATMDKADGDAIDAMADSFSLTE